MLRYRYRFSVLSPLYVTETGIMHENKRIYADLERLSSDYERNRLASLSPAEKEQLAEYVVSGRTNIDLKRPLMTNDNYGRSRETSFKD
jgi:hypothetical protein